MSSGRRGRLIAKQLYGPSVPNERERRVIELVAKGLKNCEVAEAIGTTEYVLKNYLRAIYDKLGLWNRVELALWYEAAPTRDSNPMMRPSLFLVIASRGIFTRPRQMGAQRLFSLRSRGFLLRTGSCKAVSESVTSYAYSSRRRGSTELHEGGACTARAREKSSSRAGTNTHRPAL